MDSAQNFIYYLVVADFNQALPNQPKKINRVVTMHESAAEVAYRVDAIKGGRDYRGDSDSIRCYLFSVGSLPPSIKETGLPYVEFPERGA